MKNTILYILISLLMTGVGYSQSLQNRLIAHYLFHGNAHDSAGNRNDGIVYGATLTKDRLGNQNGAYYFDGIDDFIIVPDDDNLSPTDNTLTIAIWAKIYYPGNRFFLYKGDSQFNREYSMGIRLDSLASFGINNQGGFHSDQFGVGSVSILEEDTWYHIVGTWDGRNHKIYINGLLENSTTPQVEIGNYDSDLYIGSYGGEITQYAIHAVIDDIRIYNKVLSDAEVYELFISTEWYEIQQKFVLSQNYPNPFNSSTKINFFLYKPQRVKLEIYNILGQRVGIIIDKFFSEGRHVVDYTAEYISSGLYFYKIKTEEFQDVKKMVLIR